MADDTKDSADAKPDSAETKSADAKKCAPPKVSTRDRLVGILKRHYELGRSPDDRAYVVPKTGANVALFSGQAKNRLAADFLRLNGNIAGRTPLDETWAVIEGESLDLGKTQVPMRVAQKDGRVYVDMGDPAGRAIEVSATGWNILERSPVTFRRSKAQSELVVPVRGAAKWDDWWAVVNIAAEYRDLYRGWCATALLRDLPHPILDLDGPQGSAKTSAARNTTRLIDPCQVDTTSVPRDAEKWAMSCSARWVVSVDNVSKIDPWWADELCRTVTGAGQLDRQLYTDGEVVIRTLKNVVIINGITMAGAMRPDLVERMLPIELTPPAKYLPEGDLADAVTEALPGVLALVLDDVSAILASSFSPTVGDLRMADFARYLGRLDEAVGTESLQAYRELHQQHAEDAMASDPVAMAVKAFMVGKRQWRGQASELLTLLKEPREKLTLAGELSQDGWWPKDATRLSSALTRSSAVLKRCGISVDKGKRGERFLTLTNFGDADVDADTDADPDSDSPQPQNPPTNGGEVDARDAVDAESPVLVFLEEEGEKATGEAENAHRGTAASPASQRHISTPVLCNFCDEPLAADPCSNCGASQELPF